MSALTAQVFPDAPWSVSDLRAHLENDNSILLTRSAGFLLAHHVAPEAEILVLAVDPIARRQGIATALVRALFEQVETVFLDVAADNAPALALYAGLGFVETGRRTRYYTRADRDRVDAVLMKRVSR